jgi:hypothetical protein
MADAPRAPTAGELLAALHAAALVTPDDEAAISSFLAARRAGDEPPLHLKILSAIGTALATGFFLGFLAISKLIDFGSGPAMMVWGAAFLACGIGLSSSLRRAPIGLAADFTAQTTFAAMAIGKILVVVGAMVHFGEHTPWIATIALAVVTLVTYPVSASSLDRLLSPYAVFAAMLWEILERGGGRADASLALTLYFVVTTALAGTLILPDRAPVALRPIGLAAIAAMGTVVSVLATGHDFGIWASGRPIDPRPIEWILTAALIVLIARIAGGLRPLASPTLTPAVIGIAALGLASAPGIVFALGLLVLGHARHDRPLRVFGILALPTFLVLWYYGRDMTFLVKSAVLVGSGAALLAARGWMTLRGLDRRTTA